MLTFETITLMHGSGSFRVEIEKYRCIQRQDLRFSWPWLWRMVSTGTLRRAGLIRTDVSEEFSASFICVTRIGISSQRASVAGVVLVHRFLSPWWRRRRVLPERPFLQEPHGVTSQKIPFFLFKGSRKPHETSQWSSIQRVMSREISSSVKHTHVNDECAICELALSVPARNMNTELYVLPSSSPQLSLNSQKLYHTQSDVHCTGIRLRTGVEQSVYWMGLHGRRVRVRVPVGTVSSSHFGGLLWGRPASYAVGTRGKADRAWSWLLTSN
jgi:hypothetical protein